MVDPDDLHDTTPQEAVEMYLQDKNTELAESTIAAHQRRLRKFVEWCDDEAIENLNTLTGRDIHEWKLWRKEGEKVDGIAPDTLRTAMSTLRVFLRWCAGVDAVDPAVSENIVIPEIDGASRDVLLSAADAEQILEHLAKYRYSDDPHVILRLLWVTGGRTGLLRALDKEDFDDSKQHLHVHHRPETGTPLKNGTDGERVVAIDERTCTVVTDYIDNHRPDVTDEYNRDPLLTTRRGRRSKQSIRRTCYYWTCPCRVEDCPHGEDPDACEHNGWSESSGCPSSVSAHPVRRGAITNYLREDVPVPVISGRMDVSPSVLEEFYDGRSAVERAEQRRSYLDNV